MGLSKTKIIVFDKEKQEPSRTTKKQSSKDVKKEDSEENNVTTKVAANMLDFRGQEEKSGKRITEGVNSWRP